MTIRRICGLTDEFQPEQWGISDVSILRDSHNNKALGFYCVENPYENSCFINSLPDEIFNHQLKELNIDDPEDVAKFMSNYGIIYWDTPESTQQMDEYNEHTYLLDCDSMSHAVGYSALNWSNEYKTDTRSGKLPGRDKTMQLWADELLKASALEKDPIEGKRNHEPKYFLVSYDEVVSFLSKMIECANLAKSVAQSDSEETVSQLMGWEYHGREGFESLVEDCDALINAHLVSIHPKIGMLYEEYDDTPSFKSFWMDYERWSLVGAFYPGSFAKALALQIRDFNLHMSEYRTCKECGEIFIKKQAPNKSTSRSRSNSEFCCDKCKNNNAAKRYRKSPGYKLKEEQRKKKNQKENSAR